MFETFFGFKKEPFSQHPDPQQLYESPNWSQVRARLQTYRTFYPGGTREKSGEVAGKSADSGEGSGQAANCRGETGVLPWTEAAIRCLSRSLS